MADIKAFHGYRYQYEKAEDLCRFIAPPYDMLDERMVDALYRKDPHNTVRITQNRREQSDPDNRTRHRRAGRFFADLVQQNVIQRDDEPSVYVYEQQFTIDQGGVSREFTRTGAIVLIKLVDFAEKVVLPHENTLSGPKVDRYELLDETRVNTGQIFGLIDDSGDIYQAIRACRTQAPQGSCLDEAGVRHTLYRCNDPQAIERLTSLAQPRTILIADGHHRYETALKFHRDHPEHESYGYTMMTLVSMADPGLVIRPFHRLIRRKAGSEQLDMVSALGAYFTVIDRGEARDQTIFDFLAKAADSRMLYADTDSRHIYELTLNRQGEQFLRDARAQQSDMWKHLDVSIINSMAIAKILELPLDGHVLHDMIDYVNDARLGLERVLGDKGFYGGFFIRPISIGTVHDIVAGGERMPQKSTNFFPKLFSGLVFNRLDKA